MVCLEKKYFVLLCPEKKIFWLSDCEKKKKKKKKKNILSIYVV